MGGTQVLTPRFQIVASPQHRQSRRAQRGCPRDRSGRFQPVRAQPLPRLRPDRGRRALHLWGRLAVRAARLADRDHDRPVLSPDPAPRPCCPTAPACPSGCPTWSGGPRCATAISSKLTHRFRLDKDNFAIRRNEFDATVGTQSTYAELGYLRLNRDIGAGLEDLKDREELRFAGRVAFAALLVGVRLGRAQPDQQRRRSDCWDRTASSRCGRGWAWPIRTIAWSCRSPGGATMWRPGTRRRATLSSSMSRLRNLGF